MFCYRCGKSVEANAIYCPHCGTKLNFPCNNGCDCLPKQESLSHKRTAGKYRRRNKIPIAVLAIIIAIVALPVIALSMLNAFLFGGQSTALTAPAENTKGVLFDTIVITSGSDRPVLIDEDDIKASIHSYVNYNSGAAYGVEFLLENNSKCDLGIRITDIVIGGYDMTGYNANTCVKVGHKGVCDTTVYQKYMDEVGVHDWPVYKGTIIIYKESNSEVLYSFPIEISRNVWE